jgi:opine dehydrogenase
VAKGPAIAVLGGGSGAFAAAADLALRGFRVRLLEHPAFAAGIQGVLSTGGVRLDSREGTGVPTGLARLEVVTSDAERAVRGAAVVLFVVPAYAERAFASLVAPFLEPTQCVVLFCGNLGGALELANTLRHAGRSKLPLIAETEALIYGAVRDGTNRVEVTGRKHGIALAALPASETPEALACLQPLYPDFGVAANVLETGMRNGGCVVHPPVMVLNAGRICATQKPFRFYWDGVTQPVGRVATAVDTERVRVGESWGLSLPSMRDRLLSWYGDQGAKGETLGEVMATNPTYEKAAAPPTLEHRFLTEDAAFGLVPIEELGKMVGVATPTMSALVTLASELLGNDLRAIGRGLQHLGLNGMSPDEVRAYLAGPWDRHT